MKTTKKKTTKKAVPPLEETAPEAERFGYVFNVMSDDHPGIVAGVSSAVNRLGGNIDACSQTVLDGYFTLIMTITLAKNWEPAELGDAILDGDGLDDCQINVRRTTPLPERRLVEKPETFVITAFGRDRTGIVSEFSRYLADKEVNIIDLFGDRTGEDEFLLISQVEVDRRHDIRNLQLDLEAIGTELGFTVKLQHNNIFVATNQLRLER